MVGEHFFSGLQTTQKQPISLPLLFLFHRSISLGRRRIRMDKQRGKRRGRGGRFVWMVMTLNSRAHSWSLTSGCSPLCFNNLNYTHHNARTLQGSSLSVLLKEFGKRRDLNCKCAASALVFCLKSFTCKTCKDLIDILPFSILKSEPHLQRPLP